jgi:hypothetical protein
MQRVQRTAEAETGGLLRVLLVRQREMPAPADRSRRVRLRTVMRPLSLALLSLALLQGSE